MKKTGLYEKTREFFLKYKMLFEVIHFFYTPIRNMREYKNRRIITDDVINQYKSMDSEKSTVFYFGIPEHNNLGDIAQTYCTLNWIEHHYPNHNILKIRTRAAFDSKLTDFISSIWKDGDFILFQSGYCTRYKNPDHLMHKRIINIFSDKKIIILPQTVKLENKKDIEQTKRVFLMCEHLAFISRDNISYESAKQFVMGEKLYCFPDIVTSLIGRLEFETKPRNGVLVCVRNDSEKYYTEQQINDLISKLKDITDRVDIRDTNSKYSVEYTYFHLDQVIKEMASEFSQYEVIITDRYHGTIFSLISNTPVIVVKTNDHKVTSGVDWFDGIFDKNSVQLADSLENAFDRANYLLINKVIVNNPDVLYQKFYKNKLDEIISRC